MKLREDREIPKIIRDVGFDFHWDNKKVWALEMPIEEMGISELRWHFDIPFWDKPDGGYYDLTPNEVLENPKKYKVEFDKSMTAAISHPIDVMRWRGKWLILDGLHRLVKQKQLGSKKVRVRKIPTELIPKIRK